MRMLPVFPVVFPLFAAALLAALTKVISQRLSQVLAIAAALATLAINIYLLHASTEQPIVYWFGGWFPRHGIALGICIHRGSYRRGSGTFAAF